MSQGPLHGLRVIEMAGVGPAPFCGMLLADMGADVIVIERPVALRVIDCGNALNRGKRSICLDLKLPLGLRAVKALINTADAVIEGYRPGVMERLGIGPSEFDVSNPKLIFGRVTGWGQTGPLAQAAGHDINYVALTGAMSVATRDGVAPTVVGDLAGGSMFLAFGLVCALLEARSSGRGQVIDAAMVDGVNMLTGLLHSLRGSGMWRDVPAQNFFLHSSPFYDSFECADGRHVTLGAIEPQFYKEMLKRLDLNDVDPAQQHDPTKWPALRERVVMHQVQDPRRMGIAVGRHRCLLRTGIEPKRSSRAPASARTRKFFYNPRASAASGRAAFFAQPDPRAAGGSLAGCAWARTPVRSRL